MSTSSSPLPEGATPQSRRANSTGDVLVLTAKLVNPAGKSVITCFGVMTLKGGTLTLQANFKLSEDRIVGAVTGGTGAYAGARGVVEYAGGVDTITLTP